jgi:hypothetical protein
MYDEIDHPDHYVGSMETYDYIVDKLNPIELRGYIKGNIIKYVSRENQKGKDNDLRKAQWYLKRYLEDLEKSKEKKDVRLERRIREHLYEDIGIPEMGEDYMSACQGCLHNAGVRL